MADTKFPTEKAHLDFPVSTGPTPLTTLAQFITLVHAIKQQVHQPRPSLVANYNTIVEIRDLIQQFEKVH